MLDTFQLPSHQYWKWLQVMRRLVKSCVLMTRPFAAVTIRCPKAELRWTRGRDRRGLYKTQAWSEDALFNIELHVREMALHEKSLTLDERSLTLHEKTLVLHETSLALYVNSLALQKMTWPSRTVWKRLTSQDSNFKDEFDCNFISITNSGNHLYRHGASGNHRPITHIIRRLGQFYDTMAWYIHCQSLHVLPSARGTVRKIFVGVPKDGRCRPCATLRA